MTIFNENLYYKNIGVTKLILKYAKMSTIKPEEMALLIKPEDMNKY